MSSHEQDPFPPEPSQNESLEPVRLEPIAPAKALSAEQMPATPENLPGGREIREDLRVPWGWTELLVLVAVAVGVTILLSMFLAGGFALFHVTMAQIRDSATERSLFAVLNQIFVSFALLGYLAAQVRWQYHLPFWRTIGWRRLETRLIPHGLAYFGFICGGFMLSVVVQFASNAIGTKGKLPIETFFENRQTALLLILAGILIAPVVEETIFRGYIYPVVARSFGVPAGVIATGVVFGLLHAAQLWGGWGQIALLVVVGIVFTYARAVTRTVVASYLLHVSYNGFLSLVLLAASHGLRTIPPSY
jgi:uncharacterized protein